MNPIIILWAHPRSMSTAIERVMRERGDFCCLHEPFLHYFYLEKTEKKLAHFDSQESHPVTYAGTRDFILEKAEQQPVFIKDMSYYVMPEILSDIEFCNRVQHCFLIRCPLQALLSYYKLDKNVSQDEVGLEAQWKMLEGLQQLNKEQSVVVLEAESVQIDTKAAMSQFWMKLGLDIKVNALSWNKETTPEDWKYVEGWHQNASQSDGIKPLNNEAFNQAQIEFNELVKKEPRLKALLDFHTPFYELIRSAGQ
jgi:hypothetical protein